jgi:hypothetical protein
MAGKIESFANLLNALGRRGGQAVLPGMIASATPRYGNAG